MARQRLEQMLLSEGILERAELEAAMVTATGQQKRLALTLLEMNLIGERDLAEFLAKQTGLPLVEPLPHDLPTSVYRRLPGSIARTYFAAPLEVTDRRISIALLDPTDQAALDVLTSATEMAVIPSVAIRSSLEKFHNRIYPVDLDVDATIVRDRGGDVEEADSEPIEPADPGTMQIDRNTVHLNTPLPPPEKPAAPKAASTSELRAQLEELWRAVRALQEDVQELKKHRERKPWL